MQHLHWPDFAETACEIHLMRAWAASTLALTVKLTVWTALDDA
ncbi:hypothetical protein [Parvibium lacunae]|nr:hypothetical protein [Parvibium lacunae]